MPKKKSDAGKTQFDHITCSLQGGGALGAYQVGVLKALHEAGYKPQWFVGTSIGAINAAICAGNKPADRVEKLMAFWQRIATHMPNFDFAFPGDVFLNRGLNFWSAQASLLNGQSGFFKPRFPPPYLSFHDDPQYLSFYDTSALKNTLNELIDFDLLNHGDVRLSVGAVEITSGSMVYFDSDEITIRAEHIMASGALPPGFPAVEVDGYYYWDGGISSNTPISYVLNDNNATNRLCFMVHLFDSYGLKPKTMDDVIKRKKDIEFSSKFRRLLDLHKKLHELHSQIHYLSQHVREDMKDDPTVQTCMNEGWDSRVALVRFLHEGQEDELSSKDYEFSRASIEHHIQSGYGCASKAAKKAIWNQPIPVAEKIAFYDMANSSL